MANVRWTVICSECGKKESFGDAKDITFAHWQILAWNVKSGEPLCCCQNCDYNSSVNDKKKE